MAWAVIGLWEREAVKMPHRVSLRPSYRHPLTAIAGDWSGQFAGLGDGCETVKNPSIAKKMVSMGDYLGDRKQLNRINLLLFELLLKKYG